MQRRITGTKIKYRPMIEADLSSLERARAYERSTRADRIARIAADRLRAASKEMCERKPKMAKWYCLRVESGREIIVEKSLQDADVEAFMPSEKVVRIHKGTKIEGTRPFFPSYMLVRFVPSGEAFEGLKNVKHVIDIVGGPNGYHIVRNEDVERLKALKSEADLPRVATDKTMTDGDKADITFGPFVGFTCTVLAVKWCRQARARVLIDVGGKPFQIESMPLAFLKKL
ncbi:MULTISPECIES: transcription termination/antitermination NusG family protein [unclassified Rhizobium]|uniref:transcription termination/antitermination protein NusG n=1 Tax=unclassified Rhizobium TaxID=2613769 RepID=UPI00146E1C15|nr:MULTISPECIES: transcription termination/antitermination NusG family protein [unclassified Rhizobium]MBD9445774.1 antitermination protein NusG [Rhizobium sp. RHZ01]